MRSIYTYPLQCEANTIAVLLGSQIGAPTLKVLVVEDCGVFQKQIELALHLLGDTEAISCSTGAEALAFIDREAGSIDLALVDIGLPDISGIEIIRELRRCRSDLPIMVISVIKTEHILLEAIRAGAHGYIVKDETREAIAQAISDVMRGNYPISPSLARSLFKLAGAPTETGGVHAGRKFQLTPREFQVLELIAKGLTYSEAADTMNLSLTTIQTYVRTLYRKLGVHSRQNAVNKARATGVITS